MLGALLTRSRPADLLALAAPPLVMLGALALPVETRRALAFQYTDPTVVTAFTAHYVHLTVDHLLANLIGYGLLAGVGYALALLGGRRRFFLTALATYLLAFPVVLSALNLAVPRHAVGYGFSGVNMALLGVLPLVMLPYARNQLSPAVSSRVLPAVFFLLVGWMGVLALPVGGDTLVGTVATAASLALGCWYLYAATRGSDRRWNPHGWVRVVSAREGYGDLFAVAGALLVAYPAVGFPVDPVTGTSVLNLYVHLLGFCLGFIGPHIALTVGLFD
nr:rhomboid family intramembrane serine protease [Haloparvum sedimenti]